MSSYLCFICHITVNAETNEETREKYRELVGINLCPDSQLCYICCHVLNKLYLFKSICLKRSLEYPVLFSEKGALYLQRNDVEIHVQCPEECNVYQHNCKSYHFNYNDDFNDNTNDNDNQYVELEEDNEYFNPKLDDKQNYYCTQEVHENNDNDINNDTFNDTANFDNEVDSAIDDPVNEIEDIQNTDVDEIVTGDDNHSIDLKESYNNETTLNNDLEIDNDKDDATEDRVKKKIKKSRKKGYKKMTLSLEDQKAELEANRKEKKYLEAEFKCFNCALGFLFKDSYQAHMMRHEESNGEYQCVTCTLRFSTLALLRIHTACHAERIRCNVCYSILKLRAKRSHACFSTRESQNIACHLCGNLFRDANGLQQHLRRVHTSATRLLSCSVCGESYNNHGALRTHMIKHIKRKFHCDQCAATFSSPYTLTQHKKKHDSVTGTHFCTTCGVGYSSRKSLLAHRRNSLNHQTTMAQCAACGRPCPGRRALALHRARVHGAPGAPSGAGAPGGAGAPSAAGAPRAAPHADRRQKMAVCHLCGNSFKGNNKLNRHLKEVCEKSKLEEELSTLYN